MNLLRLVSLLAILLLGAAPIEPLPPEPIPAPLPRLGVAAALGKGLVLCDGREWQLWWSAAYAVHPEVCPAVQQVPFLVRGGDKPGRVAFEWERIETTLKRKTNDYWLIWNEPESQYQGDIKPAAAVELFHEQVVGRFLPIAPDAKLIIGGVNGGKCGIHWLEEFVTLYQTQYGPIPNLAGFHFHLYPDLWAGELCDQPWQWNFARTANPETLWSEWLIQADNVKAFMLAYGRPGMEVWVTETSCLAPPPSACKDSTAMLAVRIVDWLNGSGRWVSRMAWYADWDNHWWYWTRLYGVPPIDGQTAVLTPAGEAWLGADVLPAVPLEFNRLYFPIIGMAADVIPPRPEPEATPPAYPGPTD